MKLKIIIVISMVSIFAADDEHITITEVENVRRSPYYWQGFIPTEYQVKDNSDKELYKQRVHKKLIRSKYKPNWMQWKYKKKEIQEISEDKITPIEVNNNESNEFFSALNKQDAIAISNLEYLENNDIDIDAFLNAFK